MRFEAPSLVIKMFSVDDAITASTVEHETYTEPTLSGHPDCPAELPMD